MISKWNQDLIDGMRGEEEVIEFLENDGWKLITRNPITNPKSNNEREKLKHFDAILWDDKDNIKLVEMKTDRWEFFNYTTDNIFIEIECNGKLSGINTTKSDVFVYYFPDQEVAYMIDMDRLRDIIKIPGVVHHTQFGAGDDAKVKSHLINKVNQAAYFTILNIPKNNRRL